ncbi:hypothetical protein LWI28_020105 [Acer negundo]|uniref:Retrovirus-related Pol polyprotein from transposon TNT 1-94-like beta-barrel domain-containing protein n=1 Tax=Acer negundo TaxID=4023 RepID=A0AAD5IF96_ACENE|nr:hypothetical protein LWI28_020105 [Acer negundo]
MSANVASVADPQWYIDSGATNHITPDLNNLSINSEYRGNERLTVCNGQTLPISHIGHLSIASDMIPDYLICLKNILFMPGIKKNLLSISQLTRDNAIEVEFNSSFCFIKDKATKRVVLKGVLKEGLYQVVIPHTERVLQSRNGSINVSPISNCLMSSISSFENKTNVTCVTNDGHTPQCNSFVVITGLAPLPRQSVVKSWHNKLGHPNSNVLSIVLRSLNMKVPNFTSNLPLASSPISVPINSHKMTTRGKNGISKPKVYQVVHSGDTQPFTPTTVAEALQFSAWKDAM